MFVFTIIHCLAVHLTHHLLVSHTGGLPTVEIVGIVLLVILTVAVLVLIVIITAVLVWLRRTRQVDICFLCVKCLKPRNTSREGVPVHLESIQALQVSRPFVDERQLDDIGHQNTYNIATNQQASFKAIQYSVQDILSAIDPTDASDREDSSMFVSVGSPMYLTGQGGNPTNEGGGGAGSTVAGCSGSKGNPSSVSSIPMSSSTPTLTAASDFSTEPSTTAPNASEHVPGVEEIAAVDGTGFTEEYKRESLMPCDIDKDFWGAELDLQMFTQDPGVVGPVLQWDML